jgi:CelD/BcsL family acetyltransferase involved in cellulose biosynthesis
MRVDKVGAHGLEGTLADWQALHRGDPRATPFTSPGWARAWLEHFAPDVQPWLLIVRDAGRVVGLAPLAVRRRGPVRLLEMLGKEPGDYWDVLARPELREPVTAAVAAEIARRRDEWDVWQLNCLPPDSATVRTLAGAGLRGFARASVRSPLIELPDTFEAFLAGLPRSRRGNLRRHLRRLEDGSVTLREVRDPAALAPTMERWQELRVRQWEAQGKSINPVHASPRFRAFMLAAVGDLVPAGHAVVWEFVHEGQVAGVYVNFADERSFYWYLGGFDPAVASIGLGKIAIAASIRASIEAGRRWYDFDRGEEPYKYWYGATDRLLPSVVLGHEGVRSRAAVRAARALSARRARQASADADA